MNINELLWPEGREPETVRDLKRQMLTLLVERGLGDSEVGRQLIQELGPDHKPQLIHVIIQYPVEE